MVRTYKRKTERGRYGLEKLLDVVEKVKRGEISKRQAEIQHGIPRKTLTRHLRGQVQKPGSLGRYVSVLGDDFEKCLVEHIIKLQQMLFGLTTADVKTLAFKVAEQMGINNPFNKQKGGAGKDWLRGFLRRHPTISIRSPEATSIGRAVGFNKPSVDKFFDVYRTELLKDQFTADRVWNVDETGLSAVHTPGKILAKRGQKQVGKITSGEKGQTMTVVCCVSACGVYIPPMMIFKRQRMTEILLKGSPPGTIGGASANGWIDSELFVRWLKHFVYHAKPSLERKVILIVDGHVTHKSLEAVEYASANGVVMICLPPHTTHRMQPLDKTIYGPLKCAYNAACDQWMVCHAGDRISAYDQAELFGKAYTTIATVKKAVTGFESTGLWPFNPDIFTPEDFAAAEVTDEPQPGPLGSSTDSHQPAASTSSPELVMDTAADPHQLAASTSSPELIMNPTADPHQPAASTSSPELVMDTTADPHQLAASTSSPELVMDPTADPRQPAATMPSTDAVMDTMADPNQPAATSTSASMSAIITSFSPIPKCQKVRQRKRKVQAAEVLTSTPSKQKIREKAACKMSASEKALKRKQSKAAKGKLIPIKQKLTCRLDKPRGRPKMSPNINVGGGKKPTQGLKNRPISLSDRKETKKSTEREHKCLFCNEKYSDSAAGEMWIQCKSCRGWCHLACTDGESSSGYRCDFCR